MSDFMLEKRLKEEAPDLHRISFGSAASCG